MRVDCSSGIGLDNSSAELYNVYSRTDQSRFDKVKRQCDLIRKQGVPYIIVTRNVSEKPEYSHKGILGIDLGVNNIAVDNREVFDSKKIEEIRHTYDAFRRVWGPRKYVGFLI